MFEMNDLALTILIWVGVAAVAALVWLVVEAALTVRSARNTITELSDRVEPTLAHVEQITESLKPAIDRLDPLMERASLTVDSVNLELMQIDKILSDTSNITGTASGAVQKISDVANAPANLANEAADKLKGVFGKKKKEKKVKKAVNASDTAALEAVTGDKKETKSSNLVDEWAREAKENASNTKPKIDDSTNSSNPAKVDLNTKTEDKKSSSIEYSVVSIDNHDGLDIDEPTSGFKDKTQGAAAPSDQKNAKGVPAVDTAKVEAQPAQPTQPTQPAKPIQSKEENSSDQFGYTAQTKEERIKEIDEMLNNSSFFN